MKKQILIVLRFGNHILKRVLPSKTHYRIERAVKAAVSEYKDSKLAYLEYHITGREQQDFKQQTMVVTSPLTSNPEILPGEPAVKNNVVGQNTHQLKKRFAPTVKTRRIGRDDLAEPLAPIVGCDGARISPGKNFLEELSKQPETCKLVLCCAFTGRYRIIEKIIRESLLGNEGEHVRWMLTGSTPEDYAFIESMSCRTGKVAGQVVENRPLGRKWQTCMNFATRYYKSDLYGITGSDDIVSSKLVDFIIGRHKKNMKMERNQEFMPAMYGTLEWLVYHTNNSSTLMPQIIKCSYAHDTAFEPLGAGRFYTREFLEECKGLIFQSDLERLLDDRGYFEVRDRGMPLEYYSVKEGPLISVKGDWAQMNPVSAFLEADTLTLDEYSFRGHALLREALGDATCKYLFRPSVISPQLNFSETVGIVEQLDQDDYSKP